MTIVSWEFESPPLHKENSYFAAIAQLVEHNLAKVGVASSSLVCRSSLFMRERQNNILLLFCLIFLNLYGEVAELVDALL